MPISAGSQSEANDSANISIDPFAPRLQDESNLSYDQSHSVSSAHDESTGAANLSVEGDLSRLEAKLRCSDEVKALHFCVALSDYNLPVLIYRR